MRNVPGADAERFYASDKKKIGGILGRPSRILSKEKTDTITADLEFAKQMINSRNLTVCDLSVVLRHIDMVRDDLMAAVDARQRQK